MKPEPPEKAPSLKTGNSTAASPSPTSVMAVTLYLTWNSGVSGVRALWASAFGWVRVHSPRAAYVPLPGAQNFNVQSTLLVSSAGDDVILAEYTALRIIDDLLGCRSQRLNHKDNNSSDDRDEDASDDKDENHDDHCPFMVLFQAREIHCLLVGTAGMMIAVAASCLCLLVLLSSNVSFGISASVPAMLSG